MRYKHFVSVHAQAIKLTRKYCIKNMTSFFFCIISLLCYLLIQLYQQVTLRHAVLDTSDTVHNSTISTIDLSEGGKKAVVEFTAASSAVLENEGNVRLGIKRTGNLKVPATVR